MKYGVLLFVTVVFILASCGKKNQGDHLHHDTAMEDEDPNKALYNQVMDIHDDVMGKMETIYKLKGDLEEKIANTPDMSADKKADVLKLISNLDSADASMMTWMHQFNPVQDTVEHEKAREYLETEMERIKKIRDQTNEALEKATQEAGAK